MIPLYLQTLGEKVGRVLQQCMATLAPVGIDIAPPTNPAAVTGALRIMNLGGRPAHLQVLAPAAVTVDVDFTVTLRFGTDPDPEASRHKDIPLTIRVTPA